MRIVYTPIGLDGADYYVISEISFLKKAFSIYKKQYSAQYMEVRFVIDVNNGCVVLHARDNWSVVKSYCLHTTYNHL